MALTKESFLPDEADCAETWRSVRWPEGVYCVRCGEDDPDKIECRTTNYRGHLCRYRCRTCSKWFSDVTDTPLAGSNVSLARWIYLLRELDKDRSVNAISPEIDVTYKTALRMAHLIRDCIYLQRDAWRTALTDEVEGDDVHVKGGQQGREVESRAPRERGLSQRGRGTYDGDRPLVVLWVARNGPELVLELQPDAGKRTLFRSAFRHIEPDTRIDTDSWHGYNLLARRFDHETVTHDETYVTDDGVHCNTAEAEWSLFKPWWRQFRGVAKRNIHRYLAQYEFQRRHRNQSRLTRVESILGFLYADYLGWLVTDVPLFSPVGPSVLI